jgi:hypothetical protein
MRLEINPFNLHLSSGVSGIAPLLFCFKFPVVRLFIGPSRENHSVIARLALRLSRLAFNQRAEAYRKRVGGESGPGLIFVP